MKFSNILLSSIGCSFLLKDGTITAKAAASSNRPDKGMRGGTGKKKRRNLKNENPHQVIIIGAGWSGISAANFLIDEWGITDVIVLETNDYIGGRSHTLPNYFADGLPTELGSQWSYQGTSMSRLINRFNLTTGQSLYNYDGVNYYDDSKTSQSLLLDSIEKDLFLGDTWTTDTGFVSYANTNLQEDTNYEEAFSEYQTLNSLTSAQIQFMNAVSQWEIPLEYGAFANLSVSQTAYLLGENTDWLYNLGVPGGGFNTLIDSWVANFTDKILTNKQVTEIQSNDDGEPSTVTYFDKDTNTSQSISASAILVTTSLGILKSGDITFQPSLPEEKLDAIASHGFGTLNKCSMYWEDEIQAQTWWPEETINTLQLMTDDDASSGIWTTFDIDWDVGNGGKPVLTAWIGGEDANNAESQTDEETLAINLVNLRKILGETVPDPTNYVVTRWKSNPSTLGSYSYPKAGTDHCELVNIIREPTNNLFFAGEGTTKGWYGTTVGAFNSGARAAEDISNFINEGDSDLYDFDYDYSCLPPTSTAPTTAPTTAPDTAQAAVCFSPYAKTNVLGKGRVPMEELIVGDMVLTANGKYETIYTMNHFHRSKRTTYLQIHTAATTEEQPIEMTPNHMLYTEKYSYPVPASQIKVGDSILSAWGGAQKVTRIEIVTRDGMYSPLTGSGSKGTIIVDGIIASTYTSYTGKTHIETQVGTKLMSFHTIMDITCAPYRALSTNYLWLQQCLHTKNNKEEPQQESPSPFYYYKDNVDTDGGDSGPMTAMRNSMREFHTIWSEQNINFQLLVFIVYVSLFGLLSIFSNCFWMNIIIILIVYAVKKLLLKKKNNKLFF